MGACFPLPKCDDYSQPKIDAWSLLQLELLTKIQVENIQTSNSSNSYAVDTDTCIQALSTLVEGDELRR